MLSFFLHAANVAVAATAATNEAMVKLNVPIGEVAQVSGLAQYFQIWYSFVIGSIGILATVMVMWGGFKWLTSRGNAAAIGEAKERIISALIGLALVFLSYTILELINPRLVNLSMPGLTTVSYEELPGSSGGNLKERGTARPGVKTVSDKCASSKSTENTVSYENNTKILDPTVKCGSKEMFSPDTENLFTKYGQQYNVDPKMLRAIAVQESTCGKKLQSNAGARGLMQIMPDTAKKVAEAERINYNPDNLDTLKFDNDLNIHIAAAYLSKGAGYPLADQFARYNGGGNAILPSVDCAGVKAYH